MIKPTDVDPSLSTINPRTIADIEKSFDAAIGSAANSGAWPARVGHARDGATDAEVEHVADRYRAEGWKVITGQRSERAIIDHPNRKRS